MRLKSPASFGADLLSVTLLVGVRKCREDLRCYDTKSRLLASAANNSHGYNTVEQLWQQFFSDPSQWWDHTAHKVNPKYPDFKHKETGVALWIDGISNPSWVKTGLRSMAPGSVSRSLHSWNVMISECVKSDQGFDALNLYNQMQSEGIKPDAFTFARVLNACASVLALQEGRHIHSQVIESGCENDVFVVSTLVDMYAKCGSIEDAQSVFCKIPTRNVVTWTALLTGYLKCEQGKKVLELFELMQEEGVKPNPATFVVVLNACASLRALEEGRLVHTMVIQSGFEHDVIVASTLVDMYAKCGCLEDAERVFQKMPTRNLVSWTAMLTGYVKCEQGQKALELFPLMQVDGVKPNTVTFVVMLNACASVMALEEGRRIHTQLIQSGWESDMFVTSSLVDMYAKCGSIEDAQRVFHKMPSRNVVSWTAMLAGFEKCEQGKKALNLFALMQEEGVKPDSVTFAVVLNACASIMALEEGRLVHALLIESGCECHVSVGNTLMDMYFKCGSIQDAERVFHKMPSRSVVSWNIMLAGYEKCEKGQKVLEFFALMQEAGVQADPITFVVVLNACASMMALEEGRHVHVHIIQCGCESNVFVGSTLVDMYAKCGRIEDAQQVFQKHATQDVVSWTAMLAGYVKCEQGKKALELFSLMEESGVQPNPVTFVVVLNACASVVALEEGRRVHAQAIKSGCDSDVSVANTLVDMYAKCGNIEDAQRVFCKMCTRDVVSWTTMLGGFAINGRGKEALDLFEEMQQADVKMDVVTFICLLSACSHGGLLEEGVRVFKTMGAVYGISPMVQHYVCMVDLLGRAGCLDEAEGLLKNEAKIIENCIALRALFGACRNHGKVEIGERRAQLSDSGNTASCVLLSDIYASAGKWGSCDREIDNWKDKLEKSSL